MQRKETTVFEEQTSLQKKEENVGHRRAGTDVFFQHPHPPPPETCEDR